MPAKITQGIVPPRVQLPDATQVFKDPEIVRYMTQLNAAIARELDRRIPFDRVNPGVIYLAPNGTVWKLAVDNSGNIHTISVPLGVGDA